ncbi:MAG: ribokinase [Bdellovibrionales bacterium]|jgi:ribokinase|nr:ribokinase [Bdellovibrionales bacterium]
MIIVFGSLNVDIVMPVGHFPQPGETVLCSADYLSRSGGKGSNQAVAAVRAGAKVAFVGKVGDDSFGRRSINNLKSHGIWAAGIGISERPTGCATIAVDAQGANIVMVAPGANLDATADQVPDEVLGAKNILLTQMEVSPAETLTVLARAAALGATTILNASPAAHLNTESLAHIDYLIVNEIEALQLAQCFDIKATDAQQIAHAVAQKGDLTCIITLEAKGSIAARGSAIYAVDALAVDAIDTTGAGDTFCGIFAACLQANMDWLEALRHASIGASLSCLAMGAQTQTPLMEDITAQLDNLPPARKIAG